MSSPSASLSPASGGFRWFDGIFGELRQSVRRLIKQPGFTATALATLALCIGANVAIFAVVDAVLVRPLPFSEPERLVTLFNAYPLANVERSSASLQNYYDRRGALHSVASISVFQNASVIVGDAGSPRRVVTARVTPEFFTTLGVPLAMGKMFTEAELVYGPDQVAVITDEYWRSYFNADPDVVGKKFFNDGLPIVVLGVLPRDFRFLSSRAQFFRPASSEAAERGPRNRHSNNWQMFARLAPGATVTDLQAEMTALNVELLKDDPFASQIKGAGFTTHVQPLHADHVRTVKPTLMLLQGGVLFLLLIGAVNLANLLLIRASGRAKELAVRQALGAGRLRIARELLVETTLLAFIGGVLGLGVGAAGIRLLAVLGSERIPLSAGITFDFRIAAVALGGAVLVGLLLAVPIIWLNLHAKLAPSLQLESRGGTASRAAQRLRHGFIIAQVALAFVLLSGAGLLGLSLKRVLEKSPGFNPEGLLTGRIALPWKNYKDGPARLAFIERVLPALHAVPGVSQVGLTSDLPFGGGSSNNAIIVEGYEPKAGEGVHAHYTAMATSEYWKAMGIPLLRGRMLEDADNHSQQRVCVIDQDLADRYFSGRDPIGRRLAYGATFTEESATTIVGVVASIKQKELSEEKGYGAVYFPYTAYRTNSFAMVIRTSLSPEALAPAIQKTILQLDPDLPTDDLKAMQVRIDESLIERRSPAILAGIFAGVALLLAGIGTYGVLAYAVTQRQREIGVRMALGALPGQVLAQFLKLGSTLLVIGIALGFLGAWGAGRAMQSLLFEVGSMQTEILVVTAAAMGAVVLLASFFPSRRAAKVSPMEALRCE